MYRPPVNALSRPGRCLLAAALLAALAPAPRVCAEVLQGRVEMNEVDLGEYPDGPPEKVGSAPFWVSRLTADLHHKLSILSGGLRRNADVLHRLMVDFAMWDKIQGMPAARPFAPCIADYRAALPHLWEAAGLFEQRASVDAVNRELRIGNDRLLAGTRCAGRAAQQEPPAQAANDVFNGNATGGSTPPANSDPGQSDPIPTPAPHAGGGPGRPVPGPGATGGGGPPQAPAPGPQAGPQQPLAGGICTARDLAGQIFILYGTGNPFRIVHLPGARDTYLILLAGTEFTPGQGNNVVTDADVALGLRDAYTATVLAAARSRIPQGARVMLAGHSLGGMVAETLAGNREWQSLYRTQRVVTFGSPKVPGLDQAGTRYERFLAIGDPVPGLTLSPDASIADYTYVDNGLNPLTSVQQLGGVGAHLSYPNSRQLARYDALGQRDGSTCLTTQGGQSWTFPVPAFAR